MVRTWPILVFGCLTLGGCAATAPDPESTLFRSDHWLEAVETGFVVAPVVGVSLLNETADPTDFFTDEFHAALQQSLPGTPLVSPDAMSARLGKVGENAHARIRSLQRRLIHEEQLDPGELAMISREIQHRYLLITWMDEGISEGIHKTNLDDYESFGYGMEVHRFPTDELHGRATAVLLDLQENNVISRSAIDYESTGLEGVDEDIQREVERTRASAAIQLADLITGL